MGSPKAMVASHFECRNLKIFEFGVPKRYTRLSPPLPKVPHICELQLKFVPIHLAVRPRARDESHRHKGTRYAGLRQGPAVQSSCRSGSLSCTRVGAPNFPARTLDFKTHLSQPRPISRSKVPAGNFAASKVPAGNFAAGGPLPTSAGEVQPPPAREPGRPGRVSPEFHDPGSRIMEALSTRPLRTLNKNL